MMSALAGDIAAEAAERLGQRAFQNIDAVHDAVALGDAAAARTVHADGVNLVDIGHGAVALGEIADLGQRRDVAVHRIQALAGDQFRPVGAGGAQQFFQMRHVAVAEHLALAAGLADAFDHRIVVERIRQDQAVRNQLADGRDAGLVRDIARGEQQCGFLAVQIGQFLLELHQRVMGAGDVAGAAGAGADPGRGLDHGADHLGMLAHAEIIVRAPDHDVARPFRGMPHRMREPAGDPLEVGENPVTPLIMQAAEGGTEEFAVIHRKTWNGT